MAKKKAAKKSAKKTAPKRAPRPKQNMLGGYDDANTQGLFLQHYRKINMQEDAVAEEKSHLKKLYEVAKKEGFPKSAFQVARELSTEEGTLRVEARIEEIRRVARWRASPLGSQLEMFSTKPDASNLAHEEGFAAGLQGEKAKPPEKYDPNSDSYKRWMNAWHEGQARLAKGFKAPEPPTPLEAAANENKGAPANGGVPKEEFHQKLKDMTSDVPGQADNGKIGTEAPTHQVSE
jgi:hypothetical protein